MAKTKRFTIYDAMQENGVFDANPANAQAVSPEGESLFKGPVEFPKMLFHPKGETRIIVPATYEATPLGVSKRDEQHELIYALAHTPAEEKKLRAEGWHSTPAHAAAIAAGREPELTPMETISAHEAEIARLQRELADANAKELSSGSHTGGGKTGGIVKTPPVPPT